VRPRGQILPTEQHEDYRNAITWIQLQSEVEPDHIGLWGFSYSGGHVLHLAAFDRRVKRDTDAYGECVSQFPPLSLPTCSR